VIADFFALHVVRARARELGATAGVGASTRIAK
jgi:hypothetical protein